MHIILVQCLSLVELVLLNTPGTSMIRPGVLSALNLARHLATSVPLHRLQGLFPTSVATVPPSPVLQLATAHLRQDLHNLPSMVTILSLLFQPLRTS